MSHPLYRVTGFEIVAPYTLRVRFDDGAELDGVGPDADENERLREEGQQDE